MEKMSNKMNSIDMMVWAMEFYAALNKIPDLTPEVKEYIREVKRNSNGSSLDKMGVESANIIEEVSTLKERAKRLSEDVLPEVVNLIKDFVSGK